MQFWSFFSSVPVANSIFRVKGNRKNIRIEWLFSNSVLHNVLINWFRSFAFEAVLAAVDDVLSRKFHPVFWFFDISVDPVFDNCEHRKNVGSFQIFHVFYFMYFFRPVFKVVLQFLYGSLILLDGDLLYNVVHLIELVLVSLPNSIDTQFILHIEFATQA